MTAAVAALHAVVSSSIPGMVEIFNFKIFLGTRRDRGVELQSMVSVAARKEDFLYRFHEH